MTEIFDTHAHYDDEAFEEDRRELLASMPDHGIAKIVNVGAGLASCRSTLELMREYDLSMALSGYIPARQPSWTRLLLPGYDSSVRRKSVWR